MNRASYHRVVAFSVLMPQLLWGGLSASEGLAKAEESPPKVSTGVAPNAAPPQLEQGLRREPPTEQTGASIPSGSMSIDELLQHLERAKQQQRAGRALLDGPHLLTYVREIYEPNTLVVRHQMYFWDAEHIRLELGVLEGQGRDSISLLNGRSGAILVDGQSSSVSAEELKARLGTYRLPSLLRLQLEIFEQLQSLQVQHAVQYMGVSTEHDGTTCHRLLGNTGDPSTGTVEFVIEDQNWRLRRLIYERSGGRSEFRFSDFRVGLPELVIPFRVEYRVDGTLRDAVRVNRLEVLQRRAELGEINLLEKR
ncbi:MAG: hypothetical protein ACKO6N_26780 [Myxococcota bacterium]